MIKYVHSFKTVGTEGVHVMVETQITPGIGIHLVGLADAAVKESLLRTVTALHALGYRVPGQKIVINLAPADLAKSGTGYDLPIAIGILAASEQEQLQELKEFVIAGELGLDGTLRDIPGWLQAAEHAMSCGMSCILPRECAKKAARAMQGDVTIYGVSNLAEAVAILNGNKPDHTALDECEEVYSEIKEPRANDVWDKVSSCGAVARALEIAAAGGHPMLLVGAPGSNKEDVARALLHILPPMNYEEAIEVQRIYSVADEFDVLGFRPFRSPHYSSSLSALIGGGTGDSIRPGEVSLAHNGVLFMDEYHLMPKAMKEAMRAPLEDGSVTLSRLRSKVTFDARFFPVFGTEPCPCGYYGEGDKCKCTEGQRKAFLSSLSGPVYDRLTLQLWVQPIKEENASPGESSYTVAQRVLTARKLQLDRQGKLNEQLTVDQVVKSICPNSLGVQDDRFDYLTELMSKLGLATRSCSRILKMARTIADLEGEMSVGVHHIAEAASFRFLDREI